MASLILEVLFFATVAIVLIILFLINSSSFKRLTNKRLKILFDISKLFYKTTPLKEISDNVLKVFVDSLPNIRFAGLVMCEGQSYEYIKFYDQTRGFQDITLSDAFLSRLKESKVYFRISENDRHLNFQENGKEKKNSKNNKISYFKYYHVLKFYLERGSYGAFLIGSNKDKIEEFEYEFLRIFVEHFAFGVRTRYLSTKVRDYSRTIDVLENTYQRIVDNLPVGVIGIDNANGYQVLLWNDLMEEMSGISENDILERPVTDMFLTAKNKAIILDLVEHTIQSKEITEIPSLKYVTKDNEEKYFLVLCYLLKDYDSGFDGTILVFRDITEKKLLEEKLKMAQEVREEDLRTKISAATKELQDANVELKRLNNLKSEFVSVVSHELRTPLTSIRGYAKLLQSNRLGPLTDSQKQSIDVISIEGERLSNLINDLLDLSKLQAGKMMLQSELSDVVPTIKNAVTALEIQAKQKSIKLTLTGLDKLVIYHDDEKLKRVIYNIVGNAIKFTPEKASNII